jgi:phosphogluconate dehydratase
VTPEAACGGEIAKIRDGDVIRLDAVNGRLEVLVDGKEFAAREAATCDLSEAHVGVGRELFGAFRGQVGRADQGASIFAR